MQSLSTFALTGRHRKLRRTHALAAAALATFGAAFFPSEAQAGYTFLTLDNSTDLTFNQLLGINNSGLIAGYFGSGLAGHPNKGYLLLPPYGQGNYQNENFPGSVQTQVTGLNDRGTTVGFFSNTDFGPSASGLQQDANYGFADVGGTFLQVIDPHTPNQPVPVNQLLGVNNHDVAVGFYNDASGNSHGYTFNVKTLKYSADINAPGATSTTTAAINNFGEIAGFATLSDGVTEGFLDNNGSFTPINDPQANGFTQLLGLNDEGIAVGDYLTGAGNTDGFIFNSVTDKYTTLNDPFGNGTQTVLNGINDRGDIVGFYMDAAGNTNGLLAIPGPVLTASAPEPATWAMLLIGFCGLGFAATRRNKSTIGAFV